MGILGDIAPELVNRIRMRLPRRIRVRLGDINLMCAPIGTVLGKKQRLQILGHYYEAITGAAAGEAATEAYTNCRAYWQNKRENALHICFADDAAMERDLEEQVRRCVVEGNVIPAVGEEKKIRFPGGFTFNADADLGRNNDPDGVAIVQPRNAEEKTLWDNNAVIGRIPLVATVEMQQLVTGNWVPAPGDWVHVQLVGPWYEDTSHELDDVNALRATSQHYPPMVNGVVQAATAVAAGPKLFVTNAINTNFDATDPERYNCHNTLGGKRAHPLRGSDIHTHRFDALPAAFAGMNAPEDSAHPHAVKVQTNATGEAGVLFMPARTAGDRYRLRFFLDPQSGHESDGTEATAVKCETGRWVVWKHMILSNYLQKPYPNLPAQDTIEGVQTRLSILLYDTGRIDNQDGTRTQGAVRHFQRNHAGLPHNGQWSHAATQAALDQEVFDFMNGGGTTYVTSFGPGYPDIHFDLIRNQFRAAYCDLEIEPNILDSTRREITRDEWRNAFLWARGQANTNQAAYQLQTPRDINAMFPENFETPFMFDTAHPAEYNRRRTTGVATTAIPANAPHLRYWFDAQQIVYGTGGLLDLFLRYINGRASAANPPTANLTRYSTPGITVLASMVSNRDSWRTSEPGTPWPPNNAFPNNNPFATSFASGIARSERGCAVYGGFSTYTPFIYVPDGYSCNTMHEMGHVFYLRHQFTGNSVNNVVNYMHAGWSFREDHDSVTAAAPPTIPAAPPYDRCVMGYLDCEGEFCGKCQLKLRGWDLQQMPV